MLAIAAGAQQTGRVSELTLAGLRPGHDNLAAAAKRYKSKYMAPTSDASDLREWRDGCTGHVLALRINGSADIEAITVSALAASNGSCDDKRFDALDEKNWTTGHGLHLGDPQNRVTDLYGEPNSGGPQTKAFKDVELLRYNFAWAGADVPQTLSVYCDRDTGRVLEIELALTNL